MTTNNDVNGLFDDLDPKQSELTPEQIAVNEQLQIDREQARQIEEYTTSYIVGFDDVVDDE